jgi:hypothetical protein
MCFHQFDVFEHGGFIYHMPVNIVVFMQVGAFQIDILSVDQQNAILNFDTVRNPTSCFITSMTAPSAVFRVSKERHKGLGFQHSMV